MIKYLRTEEVIDFHDMLIEKYGGLSGIRNLSLLNSALAIPLQSFKGEALHKTLFEKTAAYMYHIIKNHPFFDGNKRTGVFVCLIFLQRNGIPLKFDDFFLEKLALSIASSKIDKTEISILLEQKSK